jgi:hypothetical protein
LKDTVRVDELRATFVKESPMNIHACAYPVVAVLLAGMAACSGPEAPPDSATSGTGGAVAAGSRASAPAGDCDLVSQQEVEAAFDGALTVTRMFGRGARGSVCTVYIAEGTDLAEGRETQIVLQAGNRAVFDARKAAYQSQSMEPIEIGTEAWLVNGAQVIAVRDDGGSISVGLMLMTFGTPSPVTPEAIASGVEDIARRALERL